MSVIFCDSNCELWYDILNKNDIKLIKMPYTLDLTEYYYDCGENTDFNYFYKKVRDKSLPTTAALNTFNYIEIFEPYFKASEDILYIAFSSQMSATFNFLDEAIKELSKKYPKAKFKKFDTLNISLGAGILVYNAIKLKNEGKNNDQIYNSLNNLREKVAIYILVNDLNHLKRGGRVSASAALMGGLLNIKPILSVENGKLKPFEKVKGRSKGLSEIAKKFDELWDRNYKEVWLLGADCKSEIEEYSKLLKEKYGKAIDLKTQPIGPVVGTHCGPDTIGLIFIKK